MQKASNLPFNGPPHNAKRISDILALLVIFLLATACLGTGDPKTALSPTASQLVASQQPSTPVPSVSSPTTAPTPIEPTSSLADTLVSTPSAAPTPHYPDLRGDGFPTAASAYILPLTVRHVTTDQATLFFELDDQAAGYLFYQALQPPSPELAETQAIPLTPGETRQQITLEGLMPDAEYLAAVGLTDTEGVYRQPVFLGQAWGSVRFRTLSTSEPLRFGVFGDASFGDPASVALVERLATYDLDFVIHTGDVVAETYENNSLAEAYALKFYQTLSPLLHNLPVYTVPGNHDQDAAVRWQDSFYYYYAFPPFPDPRFRYPALRSKNQYYAIAYKDVQFLMLDSQVMFGAEGWEEQESWLTERLADPQYRYSIPIFHVPPFFSSSVHPDDQLPVRQFWHPLFAGDHVPLAFSGHSHHYERLLADGITYIVTGGGSGTLYAVGKILPESQIYVARTHFVLAELYTDHIELTAIDKDGTVLDQAIIPLQE